MSSRMTGKSEMYRWLGLLTLAAVLIAPCSIAVAQQDDPSRFGEEYAGIADKIQQVRDRVGLVWQGDRQYMTFAELAAYCAPIVWFSPDEPLNEKKKMKDIRMPMAFPFEEMPDAPVVYYRIRKLMVDDVAEDPVLVDVDPEKYDTRIDMSHVGAIEMDYFFYYPSEVGLGAHKHDIESMEFKLVVGGHYQDPGSDYWIVAQKVVGKAHGILWYDNHLEIDEWTEFPMHVLVEEGKHACCPDKNGDGYYSPGYDVNTRVNDAWGIRDVMSSGSLFTGNYQGWMTKVRRPEHRVFPPLPEDSPLREAYMVDGQYAPDNAKYELRPFGGADKAAEVDPTLVPFIASKGSEDWPEVEEYDDIHKIASWLDEENFVKSLAISYRYDGDSGLSFIFPLLVVKNISDPVGGGWLVNRIYLKDDNFRDLSWNILYTSSASRWMDGYFALGWEWDDDGTRVKTEFMTEAGIKFRFNMGHSPLKFLAKMTDFWGFRVGMKNFGFSDWSKVGYAVEIGAGTW